MVQFHESFGSVHLVSTTTFMRGVRLSLAFVCPQSTYKAASVCLNMSHVEDPISRYALGATGICELLHHAKVEILEG